MPDTVDHPPVRRDYPFALLPEWVILNPALSDRAVRLFAVLDRHADTAHSCYPSMRRLAGLLGCSVDSVRRAKTELADGGAITVIARKVPGREDRTTDRYVLHGNPPGDPPAQVPGGRSGATPPSTGATRGPRSVARVNENQSERETTGPPRTGEPSPSTSSSSGEVWNRYAKLVLHERTVRGDPPEHADAFLRSVALTASRERADQLTQLQAARPSLTADQLAVALHASDALGATPAPAPPTAVPREMPDLDLPDPDDVRTPAEVRDLLTEARSDLRRSGGRGDSSG